MGTINVVLWYLELCPKVCPFPILKLDILVFDPCPVYHPRVITHTPGEFGLISQSSWIPENCLKRKSEYHLKQNYLKRQPII